MRSTVALGFLAAFGAACYGCGDGPSEPGPLSLRSWLLVEGTAEDPDGTPVGSSSAVVRFVMPLAPSPFPPPDTIRIGGCTGAGLGPITVEADANGDFERLISLLRADVDGCVAVVVNPPEGSPLAPDTIWQPVAIANGDTLLFRVRAVLR